MMELSINAASELQCAFSCRHEKLLAGWRNAQRAGDLSDDYGTGFWARRIREFNDALIESGYAKYKVE